MMIRTYKVRSTIIFFIFCCIYAVIIFNLWLIQIMQRTYFTQLGQRQYQVTIKTLPPRAEIYDRSGTVLAMNKESISAFILPKEIHQEKQLKTFLKKHFPPALDRLQKSHDTHFIFVKRRLTEDELKLLEKSNSADIKLLHEPSRHYPSLAAAPIIGLTDIDNAGLFGIELEYNAQLAGTPTTFTLEKDARSGTYYFTKEVHIAGTQGKPVNLTIDNTLQFLSYEILKDTVDHFKAKEGAVIILNPDNGQILAMVSYPCFDPNHVQNLDLQETKNQCLMNAYELGSVFKVYASMAALEEKVVTPDELIDCKGSKTAFVDGRKINTWRAHDIIPFEQVVAQSNNIGIAQVATRLGPKLYDNYKKLGFGQKTNIGMRGENKGFLNHPANWSKQSIISLSYGYEVSCTLLQLARAFSLIANGGYLIQPTIMLDHKPVQKSAQLYSTQTIETMKNILEKTTQEGTAKKAAIKGYRVMSKTGTANILENGQYNPDRNLYTCTGIIQKDNYQRVIVTFIKEAAQKDLYASTVAAPLFEQIAERVLIHDKIV